MSRLCGLTAGRRGEIRAMHFLITAGGTREYMDPVRFISNASSGKMGHALVRAALKAGHRVTLVTAPTNQREPRGAKIVRVETAQEMFEAVRDDFGRCDCLIMGAAVADYAPAKRAKAKIKKTGKVLTLRLKPTTDILKWAAKHRKRGQILVGFALEDRDLRGRAQEKLKDKNLDVVVANPPSAIGADRASFEIKVQDLPWGKFEGTAKTTVARSVVRRVEELFERAGDGRS